MNHASRVECLSRKPRKVKLSKTHQFKLYDRRLIVAWRISLSSTSHGPSSLTPVITSTVSDGISTCPQPQCAQHDSLNFKTSLEREKLVRVTIIICPLWPEKVGCVPSGR